MNSLSERERKLVAILILIGVIALIWLALLSPIISGFTARAAAREALANSFTRNTRLIASIPRLRAQAEAQKEDAAQFHDVAPNLAAASEQLKERLGAQIATAGAELKSVQDIADRPGWVRASADGSITLPHLLGLLNHLQNDAPVLVINSLSLSADRALQSGHLDLMEFHIEASGNPVLARPR